MAVIKVTELHQRVGRVGIDWKRNYTRKFRVETDSRDDDSIVVSNAIDPDTGMFIPPLGFRYNNGSANPGTFQRDLGAFANDIQCEEIDLTAEGSIWIVTVEYGPTDPAAFGAQNPMLAPPRVTKGLSKFTRVAEYDVNGNPIVNSAGDAFDPPHEIDDSRHVLTIVRNQFTHDESVVEFYKDAVNEDLWCDYPPGTVKMMDIGGEFMHSGDNTLNGGYYWEVRYDVEYRPEGWISYLLDQGLKVLSGGFPTNATDGNGDPVNSPVLLNGRGGESLSGAAVFLPYQVYRIVPFAPLGIVKTWT